MNLFRLVATIALDDSQFKSSIEEARRKGKELGDSMKDTGKRVQDLGAKMNGMSQEGYNAMLKFKSLEREARRLGRRFGMNSEEALNARHAVTKYALGLDDATFKQAFMNRQLGLTEGQLARQAGSILLNARMTKLMGSQTEILTKRMEGLKRHGVKPEDLLPPSTPGQFQILNEAIAVSGRRIYGLSAGYRALGGRIEKVIKGFSLQKMVIKAANGDMVRYGLLMRNATAALTNMTMAFPILGVAMMGFYKNLFQGALEADKSLKKLQETVSGKLAKAFEPLIKVAGDFLEVVFKMTGKVADMISKFNEAHPVLAKILAVTGFLTPALTALLLPLSLGLGFWRGWAVVLNSVWTFIGPVVSAIGLAGSTALALAGAIAVATVGLTHFWKTNEKFREVVGSAWDFIKQKGLDLGKSIATLFGETLPAVFKEGGIVGVLEFVGTAFENTLKRVISAAPGYIQAGFSMLSNFIQGISTAMPGIIAKASEIVNNLVMGIQTNLPTWIATAQQIIQAWLNTITTTYPLLLEAGLQIIMAIIQGIATVAPLWIQTIISLLQTVLNTIAENMPMLLEAGIQMLQMIVNGIVQMIPSLIETAVTLIQTFADFIVQNLPIIIEKGIEIVQSLVEGVLNNLPAIIEAVLRIIEAIVTTIVNNIPAILDAAVKIAKAIIKALIDNMPAIIEAMLKIMIELGKAIIKSIPQLVKAVGDAAKGMLDEFTKKIPSFKEVGGNIIKGVGNGISSGVGWLVDKAKQAAKSALNAAKSALGIHSPSRVFRDEVGQWIPKGIGVGIDNEMDSLNKDIDNHMDSMVKGASRSISLDSNVTGGGSSRATSSPISLNLNIENLYNNRDQDIRQLAEELTFYLRDMNYAVGTV